MRSYLLAATAVTVVVGGIYLFLEVRGSNAASPSPEALAEAQARHARTAGAAAGTAVRQARSDDEPREARRTGSLPRPRANLPLGDSGAFDEPSEPTDRSRGSAGLQAVVDPDDPELATTMTEANKAYDRGDYQGSRDLALKVLGGSPDNIRMLRVVVSSSCILGDADVATQYWSRLPTPDQSQMSVRCARYQVTFPAPPPSP